ILIFDLLQTCNSTCFHEEISTTPMNALKMTPGVVSWVLCVKSCSQEPACVSVSYSDLKRICHLQTTPPIGSPFCNVFPFRRFVKTEWNCVGESIFNGGPAWWAVDFVRENLSREMGIDPCYPDPSFLHPELVNLDGLTNGKPPCPIRKLDGSQGPVLTFRGLDVTGVYTTFG
ncbi:hypothetical protein PENTCL1PPCAC_3450, partial [Pristionchus entomophagus]